MKLLRYKVGITAAALLMAAPLFAQNVNEGEGHGQAVITVMPADKNANTAPAVDQQNVQVKVDGKPATVTNFMPLRGNNDRLEVVVLIDTSARSSMANQFGDIRNFITTLPANAKAGIGYMQYGTVRMAAPLTTDHAAAVKGLQMTAGMPGSDASAYVCLSDLAKHWPSDDRGARRVVVMISDGVDYYDPHFDPQDPYMEAAIKDSARSGLVVYSIYFQNRGRYDSSFYANYAGQNLLEEVTRATGGESYWEGMGNPVSFAPYFKDIDRRLQNQYEVAFTAPVKKPGVETMKVKVNSNNGKVAAPEQVYVGRNTAGE